MAIPFKNSVYQISLFLIIIYFFGHLFKTKNNNILLENLSKTTILTVGFSFIIICMHISNIVNFQHIDTNSWRLLYMFILRNGLVFIILAYFYRLNFFEKKDLILWLFCSFLFLALTGFYEIIIHPNIMLGEGIKGTLSNRNAFGLFVGMGFVISLLLIQKHKNLGFLFLCIFSFLMIFSFSRSSWVASFLSSLLVFALNYKKIKFKDFLYFLLFLGLILSIYFYFDAFQDRFKQLLIGNSSNRTDIWTGTLKVIQQKLYLGYGMGSFKNLPDFAISRYGDPHNMVLEIFVSTGIAGFIAVFFTIFVVLLKIFKEKNYTLFPIATYFLVVTQFDFGAFGSKELLSFLTIFVFFVYSNDFRAIK